MANPFLRYKLQILAHSALSTGVEDDVIEEDDTTGDKSGIIREVVCILCVNGSAEYLIVWSLKFANRVPLYFFFIHYLFTLDYRRYTN